MKKLLMGAAAIFLISSSIYLLRMAFDGVPKRLPKTAKNTFTDKRDGQRYKTVKIGEQVWMAENLNYEMDDSRCHENDPANCDKYGRLYSWYAAKEGCPTGWHLPTDDEWQQLEVYLGSKAGYKMKSATGWKEDGNGDNSSGFSGLPGGYYATYGKFYRLGSHGYWWSATESDMAGSWERGLVYDDAYVRRFGGERRDGLSVRCVRD